jgi:hypothetical protein
MLVSKQGIVKNGQTNGFVGTAGRDGGRNAGNPGIVARMRLELREGARLRWRNEGNMENQGRFLLDFGVVFVQGIREVKSSAIVSEERNATFAGLTSFRHPAARLVDSLVKIRCAGFVGVKRVWLLVWPVPGSERKCAESVEYCAATASGVTEKSPLFPGKMAGNGGATT